MAGQPAADTVSRDVHRVRDARGSSAGGDAMSAPNDGGPAFPISSSTGDPRDGVYCCNGMSLRDWFAGQALQSYLAGRNNDNRCTTSESVADTCYRYADAMLKAGQKVQQ